ncbi:non-SMC condensin I complex subunit H [Tachypleus tridentatus]|uniref:non-SMC condensin I complex subunit H n=1 Tax=Tachypleus tridentatus TaxID=6853 RepID=UPI003FD04FA3
MPPGTADDSFPSPLIRRSFGCHFATPTREERASSSFRSFSSEDVACEQPPRFSVPENDDEAERKQRHRDRVLELQRKNLNSPLTPTDRRRSLGGGIAGLTNAQLAEHYKNCIKLSSENKITIKNAFGLHLIDYMADVLKNRDGTTNFQVASCTLDASTKIYAYRVDCVHAEAFKMAGGLGIADDHRKSSRCDKSKDNENEETDKLDKKKKRTKKSNTVEQNTKALNLNKFDLEFEVDPLFHKMTAQFDEGGTSSLLLNSLFCQDDNCEVLLDSKSVIYGKNVLQPSSERLVEYVDIKEFKELQMLQDKDIQICPSFSSFSFTDWDMNELSSKLGNTNEKQESDLAFDPDSVPSPSKDCGLDFENDIEDTFFDEGNNDHFGDENTHLGQTRHDISSVTSSIIEKRDACFKSSRTSVQPIRLESVDQLVKILADSPSDYSYFDHNLISAWAGPNHWRIRPFTKAKLNVQHKDQNEEKKRTKKPTLRLNYDEEKNFDESFAMSRKPLKLVKKTLQQWDKEKTTLPEDLHYDIKKLMKLFTKPDVLLHRLKASSEVDDGVSSYNYKNPKDCVNYCPTAEGEDSDGDMENIGFHSEGDFPSSDFNNSRSIFPQNEIMGTAPLSQEVFSGDNLLQQPYKIAKIDIQYARTAKHLDIKRLKRVMWHILTNNPVSDSHNKENVETCEDVPLPDRMDGKMLFSHLYRMLPQQLSSVMIKNLSVPIAFVCLLHMVNEKTLKISGLEDLSDFYIMQE